MTTIAMSTTTTTRPEIELPLLRGVSETFTDEHSNTPGTATSRCIKVPSCRPTPLIGTWADESWPLNSRQASEIITEQVLQQQRSSIIFEDDEGNVLMNGDVDSQDATSSGPDDQETVDESMMQEAMSHAQISTEEVDSEESTSPTHIAQCYMYDPYHISNAITLLARCTCEVCGPMLQQKHHQEQLLKELSIHQDDSASNQVSPAAPKAVDSASPVGGANTMTFLAEPPQCVQDDFENENDWDLPVYQTNNRQEQYPQAQQPQNHFSSSSAAAAPQFHQFPTAPSTAQQQNGGGFMTHTHLSSPPFMDMNTPTPSPGNMNVTPGSTLSGLSLPPPTQRRQVAAGEMPVPQAREVSHFMPPPPPPRIATMVFEEEGVALVKNPSGIYYHLVMRWYGKVQEAQEYFVTSEELCPCPNKDRYSFEEWADEVSGWWYTHFEHMQKKGPRFARRR